jgi:hypothetical protein
MGADKAKRANGGSSPSYSLQGSRKIGNDNRYRLEVEVWSWWRDRISILVFDSCHTDLGIVTGWWQGMSGRNRWIMLVVRSEEKVNEVRDFLKSALKQCPSKAEKSGGQVR